MIGFVAADELQSAYEYAYNIGITTQPTQEKADLQGTLIRSHMAKMMVNYAIEVLGKTPDTSKNCTFSDITSESAEMRWYIIKACQLGMMGVNITQFNPTDQVTRAQFGTVLSRALYGNTYNTGDPYYLHHLQNLQTKKIMTQIQNPWTIEIRGYVMLMMMRAATTITDNNNDTWSTPWVQCDDADIQMACALESSECPSECQETPTSAGTLSLTKTTLLPEWEIPTDAVYIGSLTLSASDSDIALYGITMGKIGTFTQWWIEDDGVTIAHFTSTASDTKTTATFPNTTTISAGWSKTINMFINTSTIGTYGVTVWAGKDINSSAITLKGSFPYKLTSIK